MTDDGRGVGRTGLAVYLDFADAIARDGRAAIEARYGNLFEMYQRITGEDPYSVPMRIFPAVHYTMGGLWVDYNRQSTVPGLLVLGEANFSDHGANRLGASALMQGLADGYFVIPSTVTAHLAGQTLDAITTDHDAFGEAEASSRARFEKLLSINGSRTVDEVDKRSKLPLGGAADLGGWLRGNRREGRGPPRPRARPRDGPLKRSRIDYWGE